MLAVDRDRRRRSRRSASVARRGDGRGRPRERGLAARAANASTRSSSRTTSTARCSPTSSPRWPTTERCSTRPSPAATRRTAGRPIRRSCSSPGELLRVVAGRLQVVAFEEGRVALPGRDAVIQRIAAVGERPRVAGRSFCPSVRRTEPEADGLRSNAVKSPFFAAIPMLTGSIVAIATPMVEGGALDLPALGKLIDFHVANGTAGIVIVGTTGESPTVDVDEHCRLIAAAVEFARGRVPVIAGTGANSTTEAIALTTFAKNAGVACCLSVVPYYNKPTQEGLYRHFRTIAEKVDLPMILYNVPGRTVADLANETVLRLAQVPGIIGLKDATADIGRGSELLRALKAAGKRDFAVYSGDDLNALPLMLMGGHGVISVTANVAPKLMAEMCAAALAGDLVARARMQRPPAAAASPPLCRSQSDSGEMGARRNGPHPQRAAAAARPAVAATSRDRPRRAARRRRARLFEGSRMKSIDRRPRRALRARRDACPRLRSPAARRRRRSGRRSTTSRCTSDAGARDSARSQVAGVRRPLQRVDRVGPRRRAMRRSRRPATRSRPTRSATRRSSRRATSAGCTSRRRRSRRGTSRASSGSTTGSCSRPSCRARGFSRPTGRRTAPRCHRISCAARSASMRTSSTRRTSARSSTRASSAATTPAPSISTCRAG